MLSKYTIHTGRYVHTVTAETLTQALEKVPEAEMAKNIAITKASASLDENVLHLLLKSVGTPQGLADELGCHVHCATMALIRLEESGEVQEVYHLSDLWETQK